MIILILFLVLVAVITGVVSRRSVKKANQKFEQATDTAKKRNALGTIVYNVPVNEKMEGAADSEFGEMQIKEKAREKMPIFLLVLAGFILFAISRSTALNEDAIVSYYISAGITFAVLCIFTYLYLKNTYIIYYAKGMYIHTIFRKIKFTYNEIVDIKQTMTSYNGSANSVESFTFTLADHQMFVISGMTYKFVMWHIKTLLGNLYVGDDRINLLTGEIINQEAS